MPANIDIDDTSEETGYVESNILEKPFANSKRNNSPLLIRIPLRKLCYLFKGFIQC